MTNATLWIEITIAGSVYLIGMTLWLLATTAPDYAPPSGFTERLEDYLPYLAVGFVGASYITGIVAHRLVQLIGRRFLSRVEQIFHLPSLSFSHSERSAMVRLWQYGSDRLHRELDFQYALVALLRSLLFSLPLLGTGLSAWLCSNRIKGSWLTLSATLLVWCLCYLAYRAQWRQYHEIVEAAVNRLEPLERASTEVSPPQPIPHLAPPPARKS
jgi:hypothetical protein